MSGASGARPDMAAAVEVRRRLIETARRTRPAERLLVNGRVFNVYTNEVMEAAVAVTAGRIAWVGDADGLAGPETEVVDLEGGILVPAYIEPHGHPFMLYTPHRLAERLLAAGTLTLVCDSLVFQRLLGDERMYRFFEALRDWPVRFYWSARTSAQTALAGGLDLYPVERVEAVLDHPDVLQLAEVTTPPAILQADPDLLAMIDAARRRGLRADGHIPGGSYRTVAAYAAAGITSCHESIDVDEATDRLRQGLYVMLRHSSLRPDLPKLAEIVRRFPDAVHRMMLTTDGSTPESVEQGMIDRMLAIAIEHGVPAGAAIRMATINAATYFGLESEIGGVAPGLRADLLLLESLEKPTPVRVFSAGVEAARHDRLPAPLPEPDWAGLGFRFPERPPAWQGGEETVASWFLTADKQLAAEAELPILHLESAAITRLARLAAPEAGAPLPEGVLHCLLLGRDGRRVTPGLIRNFARDLDGLACSFNCVLDPLLIGRSAAAMALALERMQALGGGIVLVRGGTVVLELPLEVGGFLSRRTIPELAAFSRRFTAALQELGHPFHDPLYTLNFIPSDLLPGPRLTPLGMFDVKPRRLIYPARRLGSASG